MCGGRRVASQRFGVAHVDHALEQTQRIKTFYARIEPTLHSECQQRTTSRAQISFSHWIQWTIRKPGVIDPGHAAMVAKEFGYLSGIFNMAFNSERHGLNPLQQQETNERRKGRAR